MPIPTCEITKLPFQSDGNGAPRVLPCRHVFSLTGIQQLVAESGDSEASCPRCSSRISPGILARLPRHKKLCTLVRLLTTYQTEPEHLEAEETAPNTVDHDGGHPVYRGTLRKAEVTVPVHVKVIPLSDAQGASRAWRELIMMLQVTQALGRSVARTLGYIEQPGASLKIILEASDGSVLRLRSNGCLECEFAMRLAERVASALDALHHTNIIHGSLCPAALRLAPPEPAGAPAESATLDTSAASAGVRVMLGEFADACAVAPPEYTVPTANITGDLSPSAAHYAAPERLDREAGLLRTQTDMYAFAATMYHLLTGIMPGDAGDTAPAATAATAGAASKPGLNSRISAGLERVRSFTGGQHSAAAAAAAAEKASGAPAEVFVLLRECMAQRAERRPRADEAERRLAFILSQGEVKEGRFAYRNHTQRASTQQVASEPGVKPSKGLGSTMRTLMHIGGATGATARSVAPPPPAAPTTAPASAAAAAPAPPPASGKKGGFRFSSMRDKLMAMVCVAKGADSTAVVGRTAARGPQPELEAYTIPIADQLPASVAMSGGFSSEHAEGDDAEQGRHTFQAIQPQGSAGASTDLSGVTPFTTSLDDESPGPKPPTKKAVRSLTPPRTAQYQHENLRKWVSQASSDAAAAAVQSAPVPTGRPKHPLPLEEQASVVLTKLGFPRLAVDVAVAHSAGNLEDSLQLLLQPQDEVLQQCHRSIQREYGKLAAAAAARAADHPGAPGCVVTADLWDWVEDQAGATLDADDVNAVLNRSEGAADDEDVSLAQFSHVVVHMFEQFFRVLDKQGCGYLTQEELREAFFGGSTQDVTSRLRSAMDDIDLNADGAVSLNELLLVGLGRSGSTSHGGSRGNSRQSSLSALHTVATRVGATSSSPTPNPIAEHTAQHTAQHSTDSSSFADPDAERDAASAAVAAVHGATDAAAAASGGGAEGAGSGRGSLSSEESSDCGDSAQLVQLQDMTDEMTEQLTGSLSGRQRSAASAPVWPPRKANGRVVFGGSPSGDASTV
eukprot:jgi/Ulvmu1/12768/UM096_0010.1